MEGDGGRVVQVLLLGVPHEACVSACVTEVQVTQQDGDVICLLLGGALQGDAVIVFHSHLRVRLIILHDPVDELEQGKVRVVKRHTALP